MGLPARRQRWLRQPFMKRAHFLVMAFPLPVMGSHVQVVHEGSHGSDGPQEQRAHFQTQLETNRANADRFHHGHSCNFPTLRGGALVLACGPASCDKWHPVC